MSLYGLHIPPPLRYPTEKPLPKPVTNTKPEATKLPWKPPAIPKSLLSRKSQVDLTRTQSVKTDRSSSTVEYFIDNGRRYTSMTNKVSVRYHFLSDLLQPEILSTESGTNEVRTTIGRGEQEDVRNKLPMEGKEKDPKDNTAQYGPVLQCEDIPAKRDKVHNQGTIPEVTEVQEKKQR